MSVSFRVMDTIGTQRFAKSESPQRLELSGEISVLRPLRALPLNSDSPSPATALLARVCPVAARGPSQMEQ